jgi:translocation and assembly module TamB
MKRKIIFVTIIVLILGILVYFFRGTHVSNTLKKTILPELEIATGKKFIAQRIYINIIPLFIEMKGVRSFDEDGEIVLEAERVKGYIDISGLISGLFNREITIRRLVVKNPAFHPDSEQLKIIIDNVKKHLAQKPALTWKVTVKSVKIADAALSLQHGDSVLAVEGMDAEAILSRDPSVRLSAKSVKASKENIPELHGSVETYFTLKDKKIDLKSLKIRTLNADISASELDFRGIFDLESYRGEFKSKVNIFVESVKRILGLEKNRGEGMISAQGTIRIDDMAAGISGVFVDMNVKGNIFLETLLELLGEDEPLYGHLHFDGKVSSYLEDIRGTASATLKNGSIYGVQVDRLNSDVSYKDGIMKFTDGYAQLYKGSARAEAMINLPVVDYFSLKVTVKNVSSKGIFDLIEWDPGIPEGRVSGEIMSAGREFNPSGHFSYKSTPKEGDFLDRIRDVSGEFHMKDNVIRFKTLTAATDMTSISAEGDIDLVMDRLNFRGDGTTTNVKDWTSPYFTALSGPGNFSYSIYGLIDDPIVDTKFGSNKIVLSTGDMGIPDVLKSQDVIFNTVEGRFTYRKNLLTIKDLSALSPSGQYKASGDVHFRNASFLLDIGEPDYDLNISARKVDIKTISDIFRPELDIPQFAGSLDTDFRLDGRVDDLKASGHIKAANVLFAADKYANKYKDKYEVNSIEGRVSYSAGNFSFNDMKIRKGDSAIYADGKISPHRKFSFSASAQRINIQDVLPRGSEFSNIKPDIVKTLSLMNAKIKGEGTFDDPRIEIAGDISGRIMDNQQIRGRVSGVLRDKHAEVTANLLDGKLNINSKAYLSDNLPWSATIDIQPANYNFLIAGFIEDIPEDLMLSLSGNITAHGDRNNINAVTNIKRAHLQLYGIAFTNTADIIARLDNRKLSLESLYMQSDPMTQFKLSGSMVIGRSYDLVFEGSASLAPIKLLSRSIDIVRGNSSFVFSIAGDWDKPRINGGIDISNGALGFKDIAHRLTSISGYIYVDDGRIVVERVAGKLLGGDILMSGVAYTKRFSIDRFFLETRLNDITAPVSKQSWLNFGGVLYYRGTMESQTIFGDININRARYSERVDWKTLLLKARQKDMPNAELTALERTNLNIKVTGTNLAIDNNLARAVMTTDTILRGTIGQPIIIGEIETKEGIVYFRNNEFKLVKAGLNFSDPYQINPYFDIVAETRVRGYNIRLGLDGYADQFNMSLSSTPALDEMDIFALLTVGRVGKDIERFEGGIGITEATTFLAGEFRDVFEERVRAITGFDRVQVEPYVSRTTGTIAPRLTVAKRLLGDRLHVTYSTTVGVGEEHVMQLEYNLTKNASLVGVRDERGGTAGDIKFRFEFK